MDFFRDVLLLFLLKSNKSKKCYYAIVKYLFCSRIQNIFSSGFSFAFLLIWSHWVGDIMSLSLIYSSTRTGIPVTVIGCFCDILRLITLPLFLTCHSSWSFSLQALLLGSSFPSGLPWDAVGAASPIPMSSSKILSSPLSPHSAIGRVTLAFFSFLLNKVDQTFTIQVQLHVEDA